MGLGTYLIGTAIFILLVAYIGKPLQRKSVADEETIEKWLSSLKQSKQDIVTDQTTSDVLTLDVRQLEDDDSVNFCPHCGRKVEEDHRFCPGCGKPLSKGL